MNKNNIFKIFIIILVVLILFLSGLLLYNYYRHKVMENTYTITLFGLSEVNLYEGDRYSEVGYIAVDLNGMDVTSLVKVEKPVNTNVVGRYEIIYSINNFWHKNEVKRIVNVLADPLKNVTFYLKGDSNISMSLRDNYSDSGFGCFDSNGQDCSNNVTVISSLLTNKVGVYKVDYILRMGSKEKTLTRVISVFGDKYEYSLDKTTVVNTNVVIEFKSNINNLDYIIKPDGSITKSDVVSYVASSNGKYSFSVVDLDGYSEKAVVEVSNIDKVVPTGTCSAYINGKTTTYNISATDNSKIVRYVHSRYPNTSYNQNTFVVNDRIEQGNILVYDEASNYATLTCKVTYAYLPPTGQPVLYEYSSATLKYWIEKPASNYYVSHIWMSDPYKQMKTALSNPFGTLNSAYDITAAEIRAKGYANKGMVAVNGGAFCSSQFDARLYLAIPAWRNTSVTPIVINGGNVIRNFTNQVLPAPQYLVYGLAKDGKLKHYGFPNSSDIVANQNTATQIVSDGVLYTFGFGPVLVLNSQVYSSGGTKSSRNALGQIDLNNFVILMGKELDFTVLANLMKNLGCHTAFNLDGGGSINQFYKGNSNSLAKIYQTDRKIAEVLYFVEQ